MEPQPLPNNSTPIANTAARGQSKRLKQQQSNKRKGIFWLVRPFALLIAVLIIHAVIPFIINTHTTPSVSDTELVTGLAQAPAGLFTLQIINVVFGLAGLFAVVGIMIGVPLGIMYLARSQE